MWLKIVSILLVAAQLSLAALDCSGSEINFDGLAPRPQKNKASFGEFPWTVALFKKDSATPHCAGAIIGESTVLTTAFCVNKIAHPSDLIIRAGVWDLNRTSVEDFQMQQRVATDVRAHKQYTSPDKIDNDIAVLHLNKPFVFTKHIQSVCLDSGNQKVSTTGCYASGWGAESFETQSMLSQYLKKVPMDQVDHDICEKQLRIAMKAENFELPHNFLCAGGNEFDLCLGDSGAPLVCPIVGETNKFVLSGLSSYGVNCFTETPGVYTNVAKYVEWIHDQSTLQQQK